VREIEHTIVRAALRAAEGRRDDMVVIDGIRWTEADRTGRRHFEPLQFILTATRPSPEGEETMGTAIYPGTLVAIGRDMAAVLCLIFLPILFGAFFLIGSMSGPISVGILLAGATFLLLAGGPIVGAMRLARTWEEESLD
jgi:hypothetical protein